MTSSTATYTRPASASNGWVNLSGLVGLAIAVALISGRHFTPATQALIVMLAAAAPMIGAEQLIHNRRPTLRHPWVPGRILVKLIGIAATYTALAAAYWLFPVYQGEFYRPFFQTVRVLAPYMAVVAVVYIAFVDRMMEEPEDGCYDVGLLCLGLWRKVRREILVQYALGWLVKGFFLPLMFSYLCEELSALTSFKPDGLSWKIAFDVLWRCSWTIDLTYTTVGYVLALRLFQGQIRSTEPTLLGWAACLLCYQPFWGMISDSYLDYEVGPDWQDWVAGSAVLAGIWGTAIATCMAVYVWATVTFGLRFSNLTHRGILTNGPYRYTKHPAYISKNISWWLMALPGLLSSPMEVAIRGFVLLGLVNFIYFLRARTEERHLSSDPIYVAYASWIEQHGMLRVLGRLLPALRFRRPPGARFAESALRPAA